MLSLDLPTGWHIDWPASRLRRKLCHGSLESCAKMRWGDLTVARLAIDV